MNRVSKYINTTNKTIIELNNYVLQSFREKVQALSLNSDPYLLKNYLSQQIKVFKPQSNCKEYYSIEQLLNDFKELTPEEEAIATLLYE